MARNPTPNKEKKTNKFENLEIEELIRDFQIGLVGSILSSKFLEVRC